MINEPSTKAEEFREQPLRSVVSGAYFATFDRWREEDMECLKAFRECRKLVDWTRASIHSKTEIKTWVDLALMSTGESDIETGQILTFSEAVKGFSPVIYDLRSSSSEAAVDFKDFVEAVDEVMESSRADPKLADKLKTSNRMLDRIKNISERHGDVETGSLKVLHDIDATGVYTVRQGPKSISQYTFHLNFYLRRSTSLTLTFVKRGGVVVRP